MEEKPLGYDDMTRDQNSPEQQEAIKAAQEDVCRKIGSVNEAVKEADLASIKNAKAIRKALDSVVEDGFKGLMPSRETSLAKTKIQEGMMWLGMELKRLGAKYPDVLKPPYPSSKDPDTGTRIEPTDEGLTFGEGAPEVRNADMNNPEEAAQAEAAQDKYVEDQLALPREKWDVGFEAWVKNQQGLPVVARSSRYQRLVDPRMTDPV